MEFIPALRGLVNDLTTLSPTKLKPFDLYSRLLAKGDPKPQNVEEFKEGFINFIDAHPNFYEPGGLVGLPRGTSILYGERPAISIPLEAILRSNLDDAESVRAISNHLTVIAAILRPGSIPAERMAMCGPAANAAPEMPAGMQAIFQALAKGMEELPPLEEGQRVVTQYQKVLAKIVEMKEFGDMLELLIGNIQDAGEEGSSQVIAQNPLLGMFASMIPKGAFPGAPGAPPAPST